MNRLAVTLALLALALPRTSRAAAAPEQAAATPVRVRLVTPGAAGSGAWVAGSLAAAERATISTRLSATVRAIEVEEGARVTRGQVLVRLAAEDVRAQVAAAETALGTAAAYERRIAELAAQRAATPVELEAAQAQRAQASSAVAAAHAALSYTELRSPFDGVVQARRVQAGDLVGPGQPLLDIEGRGLELQATLSDAEAQGLRMGQRVRFEAAGKQGEAEITALTPGGDALSHRRGLRARVTGNVEGLRSGTYARLQLPGATPRATTWLPRSALVERGDLTGVFVVEDGRARLRWISVGEAAGDRVAVRAGLTGKDAVVDAPGPLRDEQRVEVARGE